MKVFGLARWSGSGKTPLLVRLIPALAARGLRVSTVKHAHSAFDTDKPGKDSYEHRKAGAVEVMVSSSERYALIHEHRGAPEPSLEVLLALMAPVDLVLVEGFKAHDHDKLEVWREDNGKPFLYPNDRRVVAIAATGTVPGDAGRPVLPLDDTEAIAAFVVGHCGLGR